jgi:hypothetical protein
MEFVKLDQLDFWVQTTRVTAEQYTQLMGPSETMANLLKVVNGDDGGQKCVTGLTCEQATKFAGELTKAVKEAVKENGRFPPGLEEGRFAVPSTNQWAMLARSSGLLGLSLDKLTVPEWCGNENAGSNACYAAKFSAPDKTWKISVPDKDLVSLRLVISP